MKNMKYIIGLFLCSLLGQNLNAQSFYLKLEKVSESATELEVDVFVAGSAAFGLGSSNLVMTFDPAVLENPSLLSHNLTEMIGPFTIYGDVSVTEPTSGKASLNIVLDATNVGDSMAPFSTYTNIARLHFDVLDASESKVIDWSYSGGSTETVMFKDDELTQIFVGEPTADLVGLSESLPIHISHFAANWKLQRSASRIPTLNWISEMELGASHFEIERSLDSRNWQKVGQQLAVGKNGNSYTYDDFEINSKDVTKIYYRLKMIDLDGSYDYSSIKSLTGNDTSPALKIYPTVFSDQLNISISSIENEDKSSILFYNMEGKNIYTFILSKGMNQLNDLSTFRNGMYIAVLNVNEKIVETFQLIKQ